MAGEEGGGEEATNRRTSSRMSSSKRLSTRPSEDRMTIYRSGERQRKKRFAQAEERERTSSFCTLKVYR